MRKIILCLVIPILLSACGISDQCIKNSGAAASKTVDAGEFDIIYVNSNISLVITEGPQYEVRVEAGDNLINDIEVKVSDRNLYLTDNSGCNLVRNYAAATVYVTAPNVIEIYSNTEQLIRSNGVLHYPLLRLYALHEFTGFGTGNFELAVDNGQLVVQSNHVSGFYITGKTEQLLLSFYDGTGRFEGADFQAKDIVIFQRGSNDMIVYPVETMKADIYGPGNIYVKSTSAVVTFIEHYTGRLFFD